MLSRAIGGLLRETAISRCPAAGSRPAGPEMLIIPEIGH
jgi:hypothetical protein